jgi:hypothetical protein
MECYDLAGGMIARSVQDYSWLDSAEMVLLSHHDGTFKTDAQRILPSWGEPLGVYPYRPSFSRRERRRGAANVFESPLTSPYRGRPGTSPRR